MKKLTLSAEEDVIAAAKRLARENGTSVSSMFERLVHSMTGRRKNRRPIGPIARKATGVIRFPAGRTERQVLEDSLLDKYGMKK